MDCALACFNAPFVKLQTSPLDIFRHTAGLCHYRADRNSDILVLDCCRASFGQSWGKQSRWFVHLLMSSSTVVVYTVLPSCTEHGRIYVASLLSLYGCLQDEQIEDAIADAFVGIVAVCSSLAAFRRRSAVVHLMSTLPVFLQLCTDMLYITSNVANLL